MWKPELHPRDAHGKFARKGGTAAKLVDVAKKANKAESISADKTGAAHELFKKAKHVAGTPSRNAEPDALGESRALAAAFHAGYTVDSEMHRGDSSPTVRHITLSDGTKAVLKHAPPETQDTPDAVSQDHLGTLVARALGIDGVGSAKIDDNTIVTRLLPGRNGSQIVLAKNEAEGYRSDRMETEMKRHTRLKNGAEIGLLDYLINEQDRHHENYLVDGDTVRPIDHADARFLPTYNEWTGQYQHDPELHSPFSREHLLKKGRPDTEIRSPFSHAQLQTFYDRVKALQPEFVKEGAELKWQYAMSRIYQLLQATPGPVQAQ